MAAKIRISQNLHQDAVFIKLPLCGKKRAVRPDIHLIKYSVLERAIFIWRAIEVSVEWPLDKA
jgi:hypothetical protein